MNCINSESSDTCEICYDQCGDNDGKTPFQLLQEDNIPITCHACEKTLPRNDAVMSLSYRIKGRKRYTCSDCISEPID